MTAPLLLDALSSGDTAKTIALLDGGADCNTRNDEGATLLMLAAGIGVVSENGK